MGWASRTKLTLSKHLGVPLGEVAPAKQGLATADNERFLRQWFEVSTERSYMRARDREDAKASGARWFPHNKGGEYRKWWGNQDYVINWQDDGRELWDFRPRSRHPKSRLLLPSLCFLVARLIGRALRSSFQPREVHRMTWVRLSLLNEISCLKLLQ